MASLAAASTNLAPTSGMEVVMPSLPLMSDTEDAVLEESSELVSSEAPKLEILILFLLKSQF